MTWDVIVVGAGVVGALTARELARFDLRVLVLDAEPDAAMGATKANSGIVHGGFAEPVTTLKGRLCVAGRRLFPALEDELQFGYRVTGSLVVSFEADDARLVALQRQGAENGVDLELWSRDQLRDREPRVTPDATGALWCPEAGVCSPWDLAYAALENAVAHGTEVRLGEEVVAVESLGSDSEARWRLVTPRATYQTRFVVNAAGLGAAALDRLAGLADPGSNPRSGEYVVLGAGSGALVHAVVFSLPGPWGKGVLVGPTYQGNLLLGPDARPEDPEAPSRSTHAERLGAVVSQARNLVDGIDLKKAIRSFTGIRAGVAGGDFLVGLGDPQIPGWHRATGIQSPGLTASPALAKLLVRGLEAEGLALVPRPFDPSRRPLSSHLSRRQPLVPWSAAESLARLAPGNPERLVCRCEQVRERDLEDACSRGVPVTTVDALKRRTRAGMGWCQGRFCRPRVAAWLGQRLGAPVDPHDDVAHSGLHRVEGRELWSLFEPQ